MVPSSNLGRGADKFSLNFWVTQAGRSNLWYNRFMFEGETWYLKRHTKSDEISPERLAEKPEVYLLSLLKGYIWLYKVPFHPQLPLNQRNYFGSKDNPAQQGKYTYNTLIVLPASLKGSAEDIVVKPNRLIGGAPAPLSAIYRTTEYQGIEIPDYWIEKLLPYTLTHGGLTDSKNPLVKVIKGSEVNKFVQV
jgi:hypothetical protein